MQIRQLVANLKAVHDELSQQVGSDTFSAEVAKLADDELCKGMAIAAQMRLRALALPPRGV